jgi:hypothetical protein
MTTRPAQTRDGSQIQISSLSITRRPHSEKNGRMPMGETTTGRHGRK